MFDINFLCLIMSLPRKPITLLTLGASDMKTCTQRGVSNYEMI